MSQPDVSTLQSHTGGQGITCEMMLDITMRDIKVNGLDKAVENFEPVRRYFAAVPCWPEMVRQVDDLFIAEREKQKSETLTQVVVDQSRHITMNSDTSKYIEH